jgi:hypothetical protein
MLGENVVAGIDERPYLQILGDRVVTGAEVMVRLRPGLEALITAYAASGLLNKAKGYLAIIDLDAEGDAALIADFWFGEDRQELGRFHDIAGLKRALSENGNDDSDYLQLIAAEAVRGDDTIWSGSFLVDRTLVVFSGVQEVYDTAICKAAFAFYRALAQERTRQLKAAGIVLGLKVYADIAEALLEVMDKYGFSTIAEALKRVEDDRVLARAAEIEDARQTERVQAGAYDR